MRAPKHKKQRRTNRTNEEILLLNDNILFYDKNELIIRLRELLKSFDTTSTDGTNQQRDDMTISTQ